MAVIEVSTQVQSAPQAPPEPAPTLGPPMGSVIWLSALVALLALFATVVGVFSQGGSGQFAFKPFHGATVQMFGHGIYRFDTLLQGTIFRGSDAAMLIAGVPLLVAFVVRYRRGSLRGRLLLLGALAYFTYFYANVAMGAAYNSLYLAYVALFSASLFAFMLCARSIDLQALAARFSPALPRRGPATLWPSRCWASSCSWRRPSSRRPSVRSQPVSH